MEQNLQIRTAKVQKDSLNEEERTAVFVISTEDVDSYKTVFRADGWETEQYMRNPVVAYNHNVHDPNPDNIIGTTERIWKEGTQTLAEVRFEDAETNPLAEKVYRKVKNGTLRMASINAVVEKYHMGKRDAGEDPDVVYFDKQRLQEWSIVSVGSNPEAFKRNTEEIEAIRSAAIQEIEVKPDAEVQEDKKRALTRFEAQLIVNQNRIVK